MQHERHRGHAGARHHGARAELQLCQRVGELRTRRVAAARVVEFSRLSEALERERGREMDRRHHGAVLRVGGDAGAHRARRGGKDSVAHERLCVTAL